MRANYYTYLTNSVKAEDINRFCRFSPRESDPAANRRDIGKRMRRPEIGSERWSSDLMNDRDREGRGPPSDDNLNNLW